MKLEWKEANIVREINRYTILKDALKLSLKYPRIFKEGLKQAVLQIHSQGFLQTSSIAKRDLYDLIDPAVQVKLMNFDYKLGNVLFYELLAICNMVAFYQPEILLEIGTFNGNTTLQMGLNSPEKALIHTLDMPDGEYKTHKPILQGDLPFIMDKTKAKRKYQGTKIESKVVQHFGDSTQYNFENFTKNGPIQFAFIDGGHSYECIKSDTENTLRILAPGAIVLWHDFVPACPGVYNYLTQLSKHLPLIHIRDTTLIYYKV